MSTYQVLSYSISVCGLVCSIHSVCFKPLLSRLQSQRSSVHFRAKLHAEQKEHESNSSVRECHAAQMLLYV